MQRIMEDPNRMLMPQKMILLLMILVLAARFWTEDVWTAKKAEPEVTAYTLMRKPRVGPPRCPRAAGPSADTPRTPDTGHYHYSNRMKTSEKERERAMFS